MEIGAIEDKMISRLQALGELFTSVVLPLPEPEWSPLFLDEEWTRSLDIFIVKYRERVRQWVEVANLDLIPVMIDLICNPASEQEWTALRNEYPTLSLNYEDNELSQDISYLLSAWGSLRPDVVIPQIGPLLRQIPYRKDLLRIFSLTEAVQALDWLPPLTEDIESMSQLELELFIMSIHKVKSAQATDLLHELQRICATREVLVQQLIERLLSLRA